MRICGQATNQVASDERYFVRPSEYIPERWTTSPELVKDKTVYAPFSIGNVIDLYLLNLY